MNSTFSPVTAGFTSLINAAIFFGGAVGAALGGVLMSAFSVVALPYAAALLSAVAVALVVRFTPRPEISRSP